MKNFRPPVSKSLENLGINVLADFEDFNACHFEGELILLPMEHSRFSKQINKLQENGYKLPNDEVSVF